MTKRLISVLLALLVVAGGDLLPKYFLSREDGEYRQTPLERDAVSVQSEEDTDIEYAYRLCRFTDMFMGPDNSSVILANYSPSPSQQARLWDLCCDEIRALAGMNILPKEFPDLWESTPPDAQDSKSAPYEILTISIYDVPQRKTTLIAQVTPPDYHLGSAYLDPIRGKILSLSIGGKGNALVYPWVTQEGIVPAEEFGAYLELGSDCTGIYFPGEHSTMYQDSETGIQIDWWSGFLQPGSDDQVTACMFHFDAKSSFFGVCGYGDLHNALNTETEPT